MANNALGMQLGADINGHRFHRYFYGAVAALVAATVCLPFLVPLSFVAFGYDPALRAESSAEAFQAFRATAPFRRGVLMTVLILAVSVVALAIAAAMRSRRRPAGGPWLVPAVAGLGAALIAGYVVLALSAPSGVCC